MRYRSGEDLGLDMHTDDSDGAGKVDKCEAFFEYVGLQWAPYIFVGMDNCYVRILALSAGYKSEWQEWQDNRAFECFEQCF